MSVFLWISSKKYFKIPEKLRVAECGSFWDSIEFLAVFSHLKCLTKKKDKSEHIAEIGLLTLNTSFGLFHDENELKYQKSYELSHEADFEVQNCFQRDMSCFTLVWK